MADARCGSGLLPTAERDFLAGSERSRNRCEDRQTFQCWPSYRKIGEAVGLSPNTIRKHIRSLEEHELLITEPTMVTTKDGKTRNGNLLFTIRPIQAALQQDYDRQMQKLDEDMAKRKYADFIENMG